MNAETKTETKNNNKHLETFHQLVAAYDKLPSVEDLPERNRRLRTFNKLLEELKKALADDKENLFKVLTWEYERSRLKVKSEEWYAYNELAINTCKDKAEIHNRIKAGRFKSLEPYFQNGRSFPFRRYYDPGTQKTYYTFFWEEIIPAEHRIKPEVQKKMKMGIAPTQDDYLPDLVKIDSHTLKEDQFLNHFRVVEEASLEELLSGSKGDILAAG